MVGTGSVAGGGADEGPTADEQVPAPEARRETTEVVIGVATMWRAAGVVLSTLLSCGPSAKPATALRAAI